MMDVKRKTTETYNKIASVYSNTRVAHFWIDEFDFFKSVIDGERVIDMGCGEGRDAIIFTQNGFDYTGIDISEGMLKIAKKRVVGGVFQQADFSETDFPSSTFDGFWAAASFIHIPKNDIKSVLQETKRITKNGGVGFISRQFPESNATDTISVCKNHISASLRLSAKKSASGGNRENP